VQAAPHASGHCDARPALSPGGSPDASLLLQWPVDAFASWYVPVLLGIYLIEMA